MKKIPLFFVLFIMTVLIAGCSDDNANALAVRDIQSDPFAFTGELRVNGIITDFFEHDTRIFNLKDTAETLVCLSLVCDSFRLPVIYVGGGDIPQIADEVDVIGQWSDTEYGVIFEATSFEVRRNIMRIIERGPNR
ncbi:MAG: hypothetical protein FWC89_03045 [Defluviitaleaceae bacterium]|nr:hypothetical protein [Defluviitaleaceae bacterium]